MGNVVALVGRRLMACNRYMEKSMKHHIFLRSLLAVTFVTAFAFVGCAQPPAPAPSGGVRQLEGTKVRITGKIGYMQGARTYVVQGEAPPDELFIVNPDPQVLGELIKSGKNVTIDGHYTIGADHLFIEKIDGQVYRGKE